VSTVRFDSPSGGIELAPRNARDILAGLCAAAVERILNVPGSYERLRELAAARPPARRSRLSPDRLLGGLFFDREVFGWKGKPVSMGAVAGNTARRAGPDAVKLAARIHWQCEVHCWCEGGDRAWLAGVIGGGLQPGGPFAGGPGRQLEWEPVVEFLRSRDDEPVVLSWSNGGQFPGDYCEFPAAYYAEAGWEPADDGDPADDRESGRRSRPSGRGEPGAVREDG
jgi:hypothetical protein